LNCSKCPRPAATLIRYSGQHLCASHFLDFTERRVKKELRRQLTLGKDVTIAIAMSGGKDSSVAAYLLSRILHKRSTAHLVAITADEGIAAYRPRGIESSRELCRSLDIPHHVISYEEVLGWTMDRVVKADPGAIPCSYCGVFRRHVLNKKARALHADYLATGLNLDDTAQSVLMNVMRGDMERMARLGPHEKVQRDMIPRLQPLRMIPEKESYLYAMLREIRFHDATCPYSDRAVRGLFRDVLNKLEESIPGTRHSLLSSFDQMRPWLDEKSSVSKIRECRRCGEPTMNVECKACELIEKLESMAT
jgi:uncharacterized protein (TIGR00269 family)